MSRASVTTFGRGVSFVASGETGTQANEFEAAIKSVTTSTTVGAVFIYDTRNDSDSGAWRKKARGSWYYETLNTATRGGRREFPSVALIVADNGSTDTLTIYDLDDPSMPMWMMFNASGGYGAGSANLFGGTGDFTSIAALNGRVFVGKNNPNPYDAFTEINFVEDDTHYRRSDGKRVSQGIVSERNSGDRGVPVVEDAAGAIASSNVNDVAATVLEGAEIGALGLPIPTVGVATDGGVSVIHPNGSVYNQTYSVAINNESNHIQFDKSNGLYWVNRSGAVYLNYLRNTLYATSSAAPDKVYHTKNTGASVAGPTMLGGSTAISSVASMGDDFAAGSTNGLSVVKHNDGNNDEGAVAYITSDYNTGYMLGDIRFATTTTQTANLSNGANVYDQSVKGNTLTVNAGSGSYITRTKVATDAEMSAFSNFSADNYLSRASDTDFDFGTGDFSIMFWVKTTNTATSENYVTRADSTPETGDFTVLKTGSNKLNFFIRDGGSWTLCAVSTSDIGSDWQQVVVARSGTLVSLYINGVREDSNTHALTMTPSGGSEFRIGNRADSSTTPAADASLSLVRISATAPTPTQVKEIYEAEAPLFRAGAKCLLQGNSNVVNALGYDTSTNLLHAGTGAATGEEGVTVFKGLEAVDTFKGQDVVGVYDNPNNLTGWLANSIRKLGVAGGVSAYGRTDGSVGGVIVDLPAIDVRGDINTADTKLPDDGKLHFSGVINDSGSTTPTVIGVLPMAEGETYYITARVFCKKYLDTTSAARASYVIEQKFRRPIGGNATASTPMSVLRDEGTASMDAVFSADTSSQQIRLTVTGVASTRTVWSAELDVERISEKTYER